MIQAPRTAALSVSAGTTSAQSAALDGADLVVCSDTAFHILFGSNPTATTSCLRVPADTMLRFVNITAGEKFAVILASGTATVQYARAI